MTIAFLASNEDPAEWISELENQAGEKIEIWPDISDPNAVDYVLASAPPKGAIATLPNVKAVQSLWAGIEHITSDPEFPKHLPIVRMVDIGLSEGMKEYVLGHTLFHHLRIPKWIEDKKINQWAPQDPPLAFQRNVGVMGLGELGGYCAQALKSIGFNVLGWSRSQKNIDNIQCFSGENGFTEMLSKSDILVNLLPNTPATTKLLNKETLKLLPKGAAIVNPGRGTVFDDDALIEALDSDHLSGATLDVFWQEPLPEDHPFWRNSKIVITPHVASVTRVDTGAKTAIDNIKHLRAGKNIDELNGVVNLSLGY